MFELVRKVKEMRNKVEECICGKICQPVMYIGFNRIAICKDCADFLAEEADIEWDENITAKDLKARMLLYKGGKKHTKRHTKRRKKKKNN